MITALEIAQGRPADTGEEEEICLVCWCQPNQITFCGRYLPEHTPMECDYPTDSGSPTCSECMDVVEKNSRCCPYCGCFWGISRASACDACRVNMG